MGEGFFKAVAGLFGVLLLISMMSTCFSDSSDTYNVNVEPAPIPENAREGLDLAAVGALVKTATSAAEFEKQLNDASRGINNLDLDQDGNVDFLKVQEFGEGTSRGFLISADLADGTSREVATIDVEKATDTQANVEVRGAEPIYGANHYHHSSFGLGDALLLSWLFSSHPPYYSSWGYGSYPGYYRPYPVSTRTSYRQRVSPTLRDSTFTQSTRSTLSTKHTQSVASNKASLRAPMASQRSFGTSRAGAGPTRSGGFGRPSVRQSSSSSSGYRSGK